MWAGGGGGEEETRGEGTEEKCLCMCWPETRHASHVEGVGLELPPPACSSRWRCAGETNAPLASFVLSSHTHSSRLLSFDSWKPRHLWARRSASRSASKQLCSHVSSAMKNKLRCAGSTERRRGGGEGGGGVTARSDGCTHKTKLIKVDTTGLACFLICFQGLIFFFFFFAERSSAFTFNSRCLGNLLCCWLGGSYKELSERKAIFFFCTPTRKIRKF